MNESSAGPPNPREARYRQMPVQWSGTPITTLLIAVCLLVAVVSKLGFDSAPISALFFTEMPHREEGATRMTPDEIEGMKHAMANPFEQITSGQVWRLVTPAFIHFGPIHLIFNLMWLWSLGRPLEVVLRRTRYVLVLIAIAVISNVVQAVMGGSPNFGGMSGIVYGLFGFIWIHGRLNPMGGLAIDPGTVRWLLIWLVLCFTGMVGPIANWAHSFGLLSGAGLGAYHALRGGGLKTLKRRQEFRRAASGGAGALHQCAVCGRTERDDPDLEFRVGQDDEEYCVDHLPGGG